MTSTPPRLLIALVGALALHASACRSHRGPKPSNEATETDPKLEECTLEGRDEPLEGHCGTLVVPETVGMPGSTRIRVPFIRISKTERAPAVPILWLSGAAGSTAFLARPPSALARAHDIVIVGTRGVDGGRSLDCPEMAQAAQARPGLTDGYITSVARAFEACMARMKRDGVDVTAYGPESALEDLERVRAMLGYERFALVADGFGARLAKLYAAHFADRVDRLVYVGACGDDDLTHDAACLDSLVAEHVEACRHSLGCSEHTGRTDWLEAMGRVSTAAPARWGPFKIDMARAKASTAAAMGDPGTAARAIEAWLAADAGSYAGLGLMSWGGDMLLVAGRYWGSAMLWAGAFANPEPERRPDESAWSQRAAFSSPVGVLMSRAVREISPPMRAVELAPAAARPTLRIRGTCYPPPKAPSPSAGSTTADLGRDDANLIELCAPRAGDAVWQAFAPTQVADAVLAFLAGTSVDVRGLKPQEATPYTECWPLGTIAKLAVGVVALLPLTAIVILVLMFRRFRRTMLRDAGQ